MNPKHGLPTGGGGGPFSFRRTDYLDGTRRVYFMKGQTPGDTAEDRGWGYVPPTDWPAAGTLLRVPQVVWLSCCYQGVTSASVATFAFNATDNLPAFVDTDSGGDHVYALADGTVYTMTGATPTAAHTQAPTITTGAELYNETLPNPHHDEYARVLAVLQEVRTRVEALRPGRTWVSLWDYGHESFETDFPDSVFDGPSVSCLLSPDPDEVFFGTHFLHLSFGTFVTYHGAAVIGTHAFALDDTVCGLELDAIRASYPKFASYATLIYSPVGEFGAFPAGPTPPDPPTVPATYTFMDGSVEVTFDVMATPDMGIEIARYNTFNTQVANKNTAVAGTNQSYRDQYAAVSALMADYGFADQGETGPITADGLVAQIAAYFGFDPATGLDVG